MLIRVFSSALTASLAEEMSIEDNARVESTRETVAVNFIVGL